MRTKYAAKILRTERDPGRLAYVIIAMGKSTYAKACEFNKRAGLSYQQKDDKEVQNILNKAHFGQKKENVQHAPILTRKILRNIIRAKSHSSKDNHDFNKRAFSAAWQKFQVNKYGGIKEYIKMRIHKKARNRELDINVFA